MKTYKEYFVEDYKGDFHHAPRPEEAASLYDLTDGTLSYPDDFYEGDAMRYYTHNSTSRESMSIALSVYNKPNAKVVIYRAVPDNSKELRKELSKITSFVNTYRRYGIFPDDPFIDQLYDKFKSELGNYHIKIQDAIEKHLDELSDEMYDSMKAKRISINSGDWVTLSKGYAVEHGINALNGKYKVVRKTVTAKELFTDGDSIDEFAYWKGGK